MLLGLLAGMISAGIVALTDTGTVGAYACGLITLIVIGAALLHSDVRNRRDRPDGHSHAVFARVAHYLHR